MKNYLRIGEVAKIKGISLRSLRYYDEIGILVPAWTDPSTSYRYYSRNQMVILDIILICIDLKLPLKDFHTYILDDGMIDIKRLLVDGKKKAEVLKKKLENDIYLLNSISDHFNEPTNNGQKNEKYTRNLSERYFFTIPAKDYSIDISIYWEQITKITKQAKEYGLTPSVNQGLCSIYKNNAHHMAHYIEVKETDLDIPEIIVVPNGEYLCKLYSHDKYLNVVEKYLNSKEYLNGNMFILAGVFKKKLEIKPTPFEIQMKSGSFINWVSNMDKTPHRNTMKGIEKR